MVNMKMESMFPTLGPLKFALYGEDEVLERDHRKASSQEKPGRFICKCGLSVWSTNHEVGNRKLLESWEAPSHSFVRNFYSMLLMNAMDIDSLGLIAQCACYAAGKIIMRDIGGGFRAFSQGWDMGSTAGCISHGYRAGAGDCLRGVLVGTGTTAESFGSYQLTTQIADGCTVTTLSHIGMVDYTQGCDKPTYSACTTKWTINYPRFFNNNGPCTVIVAEVSLNAMQGSVGGSAFQMARDLIAACCRPSVLAAGQLKVTYTMISPALPE